MSSSAAAIVLAANKAQLIAFWDALRSRTPIPGLRAGEGLELIVLRAFQLEKVRVTLPFEVMEPGLPREQIDGAVHWHHLSCLIEAKDTIARVDFDAIAKLWARLNRRPPQTLGMVFSMSGYTQGAKAGCRYLAPHSILLWEGGEVDLALRAGRMAEGLEAKYRLAVERGMPDAHLAVVLP